MSRYTCPGSVPTMLAYQSVITSPIRVVRNIVMVGYPPTHPHSRPTHGASRFGRTDAMRYVSVVPHLQVLPVHMRGVIVRGDILGAPNID